MYWSGFKTVRHIIKGVLVAIQTIFFKLKMYRYRSWLHLDDLRIPSPPNFISKDLLTKKEKLSRR